MHRYSETLILAVLTTFPLTAQEEVHPLEQVEITGQMEKDGESVHEKAGAGSLYGTTEMSRYQIEEVKDLSLKVPNLLQPDYGSKTTSTLYIRGIGSRMDQSAVGLYVDGIPYLNKSAYDFDFCNLSQIKVLRGPQGTLYGRNTLGGIIDLRTQMPDSTSHSTQAEVTYGKFNTVGVKAGHYNHVGPIGIGLNGYYKRHDGYFTNHYNHTDVDDEQSAGARMNLTYSQNRWKFSGTASYDWSHQNGYPYAQIDSTGNNSRIDYNEKSTYERQLFTGGLRVEYTLPKVQISSATSYQYLKDNLHMDNDFTAQGLFTMSQKQTENDVTEEVLVKSDYKDGKRHLYNYLFGVSGFYKHLDIASPVNMKDEGISQLIESNVNNVAALQQMGMKLDITDSNLPIGCNFSYPGMGAAIFHQSTFDLNKHWQLQGGIRLDYERTELDYAANLQTHYTFAPMLTEERTVNTALDGNESQDFTQLLPKLALKYRFSNDKMVYASVAKGYKSGGYNTQMFSDLIQYQMQGDLKQDLYNQIPSYLTSVREMMAPILTGQKAVDVKQTIAYKPEYSWNYEVGTHLKINDRLQTDAALFYIQCKDQQITVFSDLTGIGRMTKNAGESESYGAEVSANWQATSHLMVEGSWGYTHATFKDYQANDSTNYKGNYVPFVPQQTVNIGATYSMPLLKAKWIDHLILHADYGGAANIYWNEENSRQQDWYGTLNGSVMVTKDYWKIKIWGKNLTNEEYNTFYFEELGNQYVQKSKPLQFGVTVGVTL